MTTKKLLLVDDEEDIRLVLGMSLSDLGYQVLIAENGSEAWRIFMKEKPPIVISDIKMPDMDGLELLRKIKHEDPDTEVVMITGHGDMDVAIESFRFEATDFITKPIDVASLEIVLKKVEDKMAAREKLRDYTANLETLLYRKFIESGVTEQHLENAPKLLETASLQDRFDELFVGMPCYLMAVDRNYQLAAYNRRFREDFDPELGQRCHVVCRGLDTPCPACPTEKTFKTGRSHRGEMELLGKDGQPRQVVVWAAPMGEAGDPTAHAVIMAVNTAQLLEVQDHLSSLGLLLGSVSHGIKGLLTGLDGGLYLMDSGLKKADEEKIKQGFDVVKVMVGRIRNMVLDVLFCSKERELKKAPLDILGLAEEVADIIEPKIPPGSIQFIRAFDPQVGCFEADAGFLRIALVNILENAVEACLDDAKKPIHQVVFEAGRRENQVLFTIQDNGAGMDEETQKNMFDLFYSRKGRKGSGLGLYITRKIVSRHGGHIQVISELGQGTRFDIFFPISVPSDDSSEEEDV